jgi:hypothetical protein
VTNARPSVTLVEALETPLRNPQPRSCLFTRVGEGLADEENVALERALEKVRSDPNRGQRKVYSSAWLADVLTNQGYAISAATIQRHLRQACSCFTVGALDG